MTLYMYRGSDTPGRKISFEKSAMTVSLKLGGGSNHAPVVEKVDEAFISNNPTDTVDRYLPRHTPHIQYNDT